MRSVPLLLAVVALLAAPAVGSAQSSPFRSQERGSLFAAGSMRRTAQVTEQPVIENAVLASELEQLADLNGFLKTASSARWQRVRLRLPSIR